MKILIQHHNSPNQISGVVTYVNNIKNALQRKKVKVRVISSKIDSVKKWIDNMRWADIVHMNSGRTTFAVLCRLLGKKIVVKYNYPFFVSTIFESYKKTSLAKRVYKELLSYLPKSNYSLKWKLYSFVLTAELIGRTATAVLASKHLSCSRYTSKSLSFPFNVPVAYYPIQKTRINKPKILKELKKPYTFVFVGRLDYFKGADILLKSTKILKNRNFKVLIIGDGKDMDKLKKQIIKLGIAKKIEFLGRLPNKEVLKHVKHSLAIVVPSRWNEPAGYVSLEASSVQTCSIISNMGGLPEVGGPSALVFKNEDARGLAKYMKYCLKNPSEAIKRGRQAKEYVTKMFSPEKAAEQLIGVCREVINKK